MFEKKKRHLVESDMMAMKLFEMALETIFGARVWPKSVNLKVRKAPSFDKDNPCYWYEISMWCSLERAESTEDVHVKISGFEIERKSNGWRFADSYGAKLVIGNEINHPHTVRWDYSEDRLFPSVRISYDMSRDGEHHWLIGNGLTSGVMFRETPQSGLFFDSKFDVLRAK